MVSIVKKKSESIHVDMKGKSTPQTLENVVVEREAIEDLGFHLLCEEDSDENRSNNGPEAEHLSSVSQTSRARIWAVGCCTIWKAAIDEKGRSAIDVGNVNNALVERGVAAISDKAVIVRRVIVVIATANIVRAASAENISRLVTTARLIVEVVRLVIGVHPRAVQPDSGPDGESSSTSKESKRDNTTWACDAGAVGSCCTTTIVSATAVCRLGAASTHRCASDVGAWGSVSTGFLVRSPMRSV